MNAKLNMHKYVNTFVHVYIDSGIRKYICRFVMTYLFLCITLGGIPNVVRTLITVTLFLQEFTIRPCPFW